MKTFEVCIVGTGRAGRSRIRVAKHHERIHKVESLSIRELGLRGCERRLKNSDAEIVIICTENSLHAPLVDLALQLKKHVLVEFPLVNSVSEAERLWDLALMNNCQLLCESISLLTSDHQVRKQILATKSWSRLQIAFQGGMYRWIESETEQGHIGQLAIGRLQALWDLVGELTLKYVDCTFYDDGYSVLIGMHDKIGHRCQLRETRRIETPRESSWFLDEESFPEKSSRNERSLFEVDLDCFLDSVQNIRPHYLEKEACLGVLTLAEQISQWIADSLAKESETESP
jgi:predicted dehydrogenase